MVNKVIYQGRLTADLEVKYTQSNVAYAEFTIAWSEKYKEMETKSFLRCKAWRNNAEFIEKYFKKGTMILIEGHMVTEEWEANGEKKSRSICLIDRAHFCGDRGHQSNNQQTGTPVPEEAGKPDADGFMNIPDGVDDELPFL
jgi:single-strand DNA-binding protein